MAVLISYAHAKCYFAFEQLIVALQHPVRDFNDQLPLKDVQEEFDKYKIWAGNVGAPHSGKRYEISLDYRLREASFLKEQVLSLLKTLDEKVGTATSLLRNERKPFEEEADEKSDSDASTTSAVSGDGDESDVDVDSPWEISSSDSNDSKESVDINSRPGSVGSVSQPHAVVSTAGATKAIIRLGRTPTLEMPRLLESIKFTIACLYRVPIRKPAPLDRLKHRTAIDSSSYQHFDVLYVTDKFPGIDPDLAARLGKMITRRRQILYYREAHRQSLDTSRVEPKNKPVVEPAPTSFVIEGGGELVQAESGSQAAPSQLALSQAASSHFTLRSKATTVRPGENPLPALQEHMDPTALYAPSVAESKSSMASSYAGAELEVKVPPRPKDDDGNELSWFECPYCLITKNITTERRWRKHIFEDLQPYVCTYQDCDLYDKFFENRDAWYKHEVQKHKSKWFCNTDDHPEYESEDEFRNHMRIDHNQIDTQFSLLRDMFRQPSRGIGGTCNLCQRESQKLKSHVSRHLQQLALFALPRVNETAGSGKAERDTRSSRYETKASGSEIDSASSEKSLSSRGIDDTVDHAKTNSDDGSETSGVDDDFEAIDVPDAADLGWDNVTDKFSKARKGGFRTLSILLYGVAQGVFQRLEAMLAGLRCWVVSNDTTLADDMKHYDVVFTSVRFVDMESGLAQLDSFKNWVSSEKVIISVFDEDALGSDSERVRRSYDADITEAFHDSDSALREKIEHVFRELCNWEPPPAGFVQNAEAAVDGPHSDTAQSEDEASGVTLPPEPAPFWLADYVRMKCSSLYMYDRNDIVKTRLAGHMDSRIKKMQAPWPVDPKEKKLPSTSSADIDSIDLSRVFVFNTGRPWPFRRAPPFVEFSPQLPSTCPYCKSVVSFPEWDSVGSIESHRLNREVVWRKHILDDLKPFICIDDECQQGNLASGSLSWWVKHMSQHNVKVLENGRSCELCSEICSEYHLPNHLLDLAAFALPTGLDPVEEDLLLNRSEEGESLRSSAVLAPSTSASGSIDVSSSSIAEDAEVSDERHAMAQDPAIPAIEGAESMGWGFVGRVFEQGNDANLVQDLTEADPILRAFHSKQQPGTVDTVSEEQSRNDTDPRAHYADDLRTYMLPLLKAQLDILDRASKLNVGDLGFTRVCQQHVRNVLTHIKISEFPYLKWQTFRFIVFSHFDPFAGILYYKTEEVENFKTQFHKLWIETLTMVPDLPNFRIDEVITDVMQPHQRPFRRVIHRREYSDRFQWRYSESLEPESHDTLEEDRWFHEADIRSLAVQPRDEADIYRLESFSPYPCRNYIVDCTKAFASPEERDSHEKENTCSSEFNINSRSHRLQFEPTSSQLTRLSEHFCSFKNCPSSFPTSEDLDQHELFCEHGFIADDTLHQQDTATLQHCRLIGCSDVFQTSQERNEHEDVCKHRHDITIGDDSNSTKEQRQAEIRDEINKERKILKGSENLLEAIMDTKANKYQRRQAERQIKLSNDKIKRLEATMVTEHFRSSIELQAGQGGTNAENDRTSVQGSNLNTDDAQRRSFEAVEEYTQILICRNPACLHPCRNHKDREIHETQRCPLNEWSWRVEPLSKGLSCPNEGCELRCGTEAFRDEHAAKFCDYRKDKSTEKNEYAIAGARERYPYGFDAFNPMTEDRWLPKPIRGIVPRLLPMDLIRQGVPMPPLDDEDEDIAPEDSVSNKGRKSDEELDREGAARRNARWLNPHPEKPETSKGSSRFSRFIDNIRPGRKIKHDPAKT